MQFRRAKLSFNFCLASKTSKILRCAEFSVQFSSTVQLYGRRVNNKEEEDGSFIWQHSREKRIEVALGHVIPLAIRMN